MTKKLILFSLLVTASQWLNAQDADASANGDHTLAIMLTLGAAVSALVLAVINAFRISHNRTISEVEMVNQKDDLNVTMEAVKVALTREIRSLGRDHSKGNRGSHQRDTHVSVKAASGEKTDPSVEKSDEKKPFKKRSSNHRRRPPHRKPNKNTDQSEN